jgi:TRAP-type C4-dicarboxylate transport system permease small subunit
MLDKYLNLYCNLLGKVIAILLALMVVLVFGNVILRYGFNSGITVSEELSRWFFVWLTFLGGIIALHEHAHLGTDFFVSRLSVLGKKICLVLGYALMLLMSWLMFWGALQQTNINYASTAPASGLSMAWFYGIGVLFGLSAMVILTNDLYKILTGQIKDEDLIRIRESEELAITAPAGEPLAGASK